MSRLFTSNSSIISTDSELIIELKQSEISLLALELSMLLMGLIEKIVIVFGANAHLRICLNRNMLPGDKAIFVNSSRGFTVDLSETHVEYLCSFLMKAYRDQIAEVNHLHVEGLMGKELFDLTLLFEKYISPMTPEEAKKLMND